MKIKLIDKLAQDHCYDEDAYAIYPKKDMMRAYRAGFIKAKELIIEKLNNELDLGLGILQELLKLDVQEIDIDQKIYTNEI